MNRVESAAPPPTPVFALRGGIRVQRGVSMGMREPVLLCRFDARDISADACVEVVDFLRREQDPPSAAASAADDPLLSLIAQCGASAVRLQRAAALPVFESQRVQRVGGAQAAEYRLAVPYWRAGAAIRATETVITAVAQLLAAWNTADWPRACLAAQASIRSVQVELARLAPGASNVLRFLHAAVELNVPWTSLAGSIIRVGHGARSRWLDSSLTDATSCIGANLARDKWVAAAVLREAGLPVPAHARVADAEAAVQSADALGYPVVVKPGNCEQGKGVSVNLGDPAAVRRAYEQAVVHSPSVLVEQHVHGRDYRLTVLHGRLIWAIERKAGAVVGDGRHSVRQLVEQLNLDPRRGRHARAALKPLDLDDEAAGLLAVQGLDADSVPALDAVVPLRRVANVARGGLPVAVNEQVHPDNRRLAERAAAALRLDLAGIDLIIPDIARSWLDGQGAICEINAQPSLGATTAPQLYGEILKALLGGGDGRIPITVIVGARHGAAVAARIERFLRGQGVATGLVNREGVWIGGQRVAPSRGQLCADALVLLADPQVEQVIVVIDQVRSLREGLPFDRYGDLILADAELEQQAGASLSSAVVTVLLPACTRRVLHDPLDEACARWALATPRSEAVVIREDDDDEARQDQFFRAWRTSAVLA